MARNWERSENLAKELSSSVEARLVVADDDTESESEGDELVDVKKISTYKKDKSNEWKKKFGDQSQQQRKEFETKQAMGEGTVPAAGREHPTPNKKCWRCKLTGKIPSAGKARTIPSVCHCAMKSLQHSLTRLFIREEGNRLLINSSKCWGNIVMQNWPINSRIANISVKP